MDELLKVYVFFLNEFYQKQAKKKRSDEFGKFTTNVKSAYQKKLNIRKKYI